MRQKNNRFKVKKLFVLGAGASYSATRPSVRYSPKKPPPRKQTPLDKHFTKLISELKVERPSWVDKSVGIINKAWKDHVDLFCDVGLEQAILLQAANMKFAKAIKPKRHQHSIEFEEYVNHMAHVIAFYLRRARQGTEKHTINLRRIFLTMKKLQIASSHLTTMMFSIKLY